MQNFMKTIINSIKTWTKKEIKDSVADWNENDSSKDSYIKNRTHWKEYVKTDYLKEQTFDLNKLTKNDWYYSDIGDMILNKTKLEVGKNYTIVFDGVEYKETLRDVESGLCFGKELPWYFSGPDVPYGIYIHFEGNCYVSASSEGPHTFAIYEYGNVFHRLDKNYLPKIVENSFVEIYQYMDDATSEREAKMDKINPTGTGSFSINRKPNTTIGAYSHAEGYNTTASGKYSHAEGNNTTASGDYSHAEGNNTTARGYDSHAEGYYTTASGHSSHAEGYITTASGDNSHAEGNNTTASGKYSHAEGYQSEATDSYSHAEGYFTTARGYDSHAEGGHTTASGAYSHAEGDYTTASGKCSHAEGDFTTASGESQHVQGKFNISDPDSKYSHIVGNGTSGNVRSNAHTLDWDGNAWYQGDVYVGSNSGTNKDDGSKKLATEEYVNEAVGEATKENEFELIERVETTEEITSFIRDKEPNGTLYDFKRLYMNVFTPKAEKTVAGYIEVNDKKVVYTPYMLVETGAKETTVVAEVQNGALCVTGRNAATGEGDTGNYANLYKGGFITLGETEINKVSAYLVSDSFPIGTVFEIWGVRS